MVNWVEKAYKIISDDKDMVIKSFDVCGITTTKPAKVRSGDFYVKCMEKAKSILDNDNSDDTEDDIFHCKFIRDFIFDTLFSVEKVA